MMTDRVRDTVLACWLGFLIGLATMSAAQAETFEDEMLTYVGKSFSVVVEKYGKPTFSYPTMRCPDRTDCTIHRAQQYDFGNHYVIFLVDAHGIVQAIGGASLTPFGEKR